MKKHSPTINKALFHSLSQCHSIAALLHKNEDALTWVRPQYFDLQSFKDYLIIIF